MKRQPKPHKPKARIAAAPARIGLAFLILTVVLGGVIIYFVLGTTTVTITRSPVPVETEITVRLTPAEESAAEQDGADVPLVAAALATETVTVSETFTPSGEPQRSEQQATGTVTIYNNWSQTQPLAATTRLLSESGVLFRIPERVDVPAGGSVTTPIIADQAGASGEIDPSRFTLPGLWKGLQDSIYAQSTEPTTGGVVEITVLTEDDITAATDALKTKAEEAAKEKIATADVPQEGLTLAEQSIQHVITDTERNAELGEQVESFTMTQTEDVTGVFLDMDALQTTARAKLTESIQTGNDSDTAYALTDDAVNLTFAFPDDTLTLPQDITMTVAGTALLTGQADVLQARNLVSRSRARIEEYLADVEGVKSVDVRFSPFWVTRAPANPAQITVKVQ